jgi:predicted DNA-binding protein
MASINFSPELEAKLARLASESGRSVEDIIREVVADYVEEQEDGERALEVLRRNEPTISLEEVERRLGLED